MLTVHKLNLKHLAVSVAISLGTGTLAGLLTMGSMETFSQLSKPPLSPPGWVFPVVWTLLYILMGVSAYLVYEQNPRVLSPGLVFYTVQLALNFVWPMLFFNLQWFFIAFLELLLLWAAVILTVIEFSKQSAGAAYLQLPYLVWVSFALYLNLGVFVLN